MTTRKTYESVGILIAIEKTKQTLDDLEVIYDYFKANKLDMQHYSRLADILMSRKQKPQETTT